MIFQRDWIFVISHNVKMWYYKGHCDFSSMIDFVNLTFKTIYIPKIMIYGGIFLWIYWSNVEDTF